LKCADKYGLEPESSGGKPVTIDSSAGRVSRLDDRFVEAARNDVVARKNLRVQRLAARRAWKQDATQTILWLREVEAKEAVPLMRAIAKAEKVAGHRLVLKIDNELVLCSRGFRIATPYPYAPPALIPDFTTYRLRCSALELGRNLVSEGKSVKERIKRSLKAPDIEKRLLYQGLDEWPAVGKICWYGALVGTAFMPWWLVVYEMHCAAFRRAFAPVEQ
jgi:hypothetical protein